MSKSLGRARSPFVQTCRDLAPLLAEHAWAAEAARDIAPEVIAAADEADLFRAVVPGSLGGQGLGLDDLANGTRELAKGCPATAWTLSFLVMHGWLLSRFPAAAHGRLFGGDRPPLAAAPLAPGGAATRQADGSYILSGTWEWATGVNLADWVIVHALAGDATSFFAVPAEQATIEDVWHTAGMRATGSNTVVLDEVVVPPELAIDAMAFFGGPSVVAGDGLAGLPVISVLSMIASAPALGAAQAAVQLYRDQLQTRLLAYTVGESVKDKPASQIRLAAQWQRVREVHAAWQLMVHELADAARNGAVDLDDRVAARLTAAATVQSSRRLISDVGEGAGASVYKSEHPLQRLQRDVETLKGHAIFDWDRAAELAGRHLLGFELGPMEMV